MLSIHLEWFERHTETDATQLLLLHKVKETATKKVHGNEQVKKFNQLYIYVCVCV